MKLEVGQKVWIFDRNNRVYVDENGNKTVGATYRGHFVPRIVIGETSRSWILAYSELTPLDRGWKVNKKEAHEIIITSEEEIDRRCWIHKNAHKIAELVNRCKDYDKLKSIEAMLLGGSTDES